MKNILILCSAVLITGFGYAAWRFSQPEHFGGDFVGATQVSVRQLVHDGATQAAGDVRVEGEVVRQCPASGCWFYLDDGRGNRVKVEMSQVVPRLPQKVGSRAVVEGRMVMMGDEAVLAGSGVEFK